MEPLCVFCVVVVSCAKELDEELIMAGKMKFWDVELILNAKVNEDTLVLMEGCQSTFEKIQGFAYMDQILCKIKEVQHPSHSTDKALGIHVIWKVDIKNESQEKP